MLKSNKLKLNKKQSQDGGFLPLLLGAHGSLAAPVLGSLFGKGLQVDAQQRVPRGKGVQVDPQQRPYRRVPASKKKINFHNKPMSNFDIMNWVKELKINNFDGIFNNDSRQWAHNCGIINLDSNNGPGTHGVCNVDSFYFEPFGLPPPENISFYQMILYVTISKKDISSLWLILSFFCFFVFCCCFFFFCLFFFFVFLFCFFLFFFFFFFCFFFIKKIQDGISIYNIVYKILDPINPSKNETILKDYFINYGNV